MRCEHHLWMEGPSQHSTHGQADRQAVSGHATRGKSTTML
jgi:hypothetical protein